MNLSRVTLLSHLESRRDRINSDDLLGPLQESPLDRADSNRSASPDRNHVSFLDSGVDDGVVGCGEDVG